MSFPDSLLIELPAPASSAPRAVADDQHLRLGVLADHRANPLAALVAVEAEEDGPGAVRVAQEVEEQFGIVVHVETSVGPLSAALEDSPVGDLVVRVCREALVNAAKHGGPSKISVSLQTTTSTACC